MTLSVELRCLLQSFFSQNAFTEVNLRALIAELLYEGAREDVTREIILNTIAEVNIGISDLDFEIRRTVQQVDGKDIWVLCNTTSDSLTQLATVHTQNEIAFFKVLLNGMFIKNNTRRAETLAIPNMEALRDATTAGLTKAQAETALRQFVAEAWIQKSKNGFYSLTARSLMELQGYLKDTYNDNDEESDAIKSCYACKDFLTMGYRCPDLNCNCRFHFKCYDAFFKGSLRCPVCRQADWQKHLVNHVGERAVRHQTHEESERSDDDDDQAAEDGPGTEIEED